jgi:NAD(P)-dependent dehydrogenase (short-subunit alcohol dehydrogenase family)
MTQTLDVPAVSRVILVTGAASGMGLATARRFHAAGCRVVVWDIDAVRLKDAWSDAPASEVLVDVVDISNATSTDAGATRLLEAFGRLDVVVNNAALHGGDWQRDCLSLAPEEWQRIMGVNIFGTINVLRSCGDALSAAQGVVVNISSMVAYGHGPSSPYAVTKVAMNGLTMALADELGRRGVRVVGVAPGLVATDIIVEHLGPERMAELLAAQSLPTPGQPEDVANLTFFLASDEARLVVGHTVLADVGINRRP